MPREQPINYDKKLVDSINKDLLSYKELVDNSPIGLYKNTPGSKGKFLEINPAMIKIFEASSYAEMLNTSVSDVYTDAAKRKIFSDNLLKNKIVKEELLELTTLKGRKIWCAVTAIVEQNEAGDICFYGAIQEVTQRVEAERELLRSKLLIESIVNTTLDGISVIDANAKILSYNKRFQEMWSIPDELLSIGDSGKVLQHILTLIQNPEIYFEHVKEVYFGKTEKSRDEIELKNGNTYERYSAPLIDEKGENYGRVCFFQDISQRKNFEKELAYSEKKFHAILDQSFQFIGLLSLDGILLEVNQSALKFADIEEGDVVGKPFWETPWWSHSKEVQKNLRNAINKSANGEFVRFETTYLNKSGGVEYIDFSLKSFLDDTGKVTLLIAEGRPITELRQIEANYRNIFDNVPDAIAEINLALLKEHLNKLAVSGIMDLDLYLKTNRAELYNCFNKIKINDVNKSFLQLYEAKSKEELISSVSSFFGIESFEAAKGLMLAIQQNRKYLKEEMEIYTLNKNKIEVIFQYSVSPITDDFSKTLISLSDITKQKQIEMQLAYSSVHDPLTGLPNRNLFDESLTSSLARAKRASEKMALLYIDIDHFKSINDTFGHDLGDLLLVKFSTKLKNAIREDDFVARIGGDEFVIILNGLMDVADAGVITKKLLSIISSKYDLAGNEVNITASIGIVIYPDATEDPMVLKKYADIALYSVKNNGRSNFKYYLANKDYESRVKLEKEFINALATNQLYLMYQPKYNIKDNRLFGMEVLIRWQNDDYGLVFPENFIPYAEESGMMAAIGQWIITMACKQYMQWFENFNLKEKPRLEINLSYQQLEQQDFLAVLDDILLKTTMDPSCLTFELTEEALKRSENAATITKQLYDKGIRISIDDVGYNMSFLKEIQNYHASTIKINQHIIAEILSDVHSGEVVNNIINFSNEHNLNVVAEGVENKSQVNYLSDAGCYIMQGYYLCKPLDADLMEEIIKAGITV